MCNLDYDSPDFYNSTDRIARKSHLCYECGRTINQKEKYRYVFAVYGSHADAYKTCAHCLVGQQWLWVQCGGYAHGNLENEILEHAEDYKRFDLYRFVISMRKQWDKKNVRSLKD